MPIHNRCFDGEISGEQHEASFSNGPSSIGSRRRGGHVSVLFLRAVFAAARRDARLILSFLQDFDTIRKTKSSPGRV